MLENFIDAFGEMSSRRRPGTLRLSAENATVSLKMFDGRILGIESETRPGVEGLVERFIRAGVLPAKMSELMKGRKISLPQLQEVLVSRGFLSGQQFRHAKIMYELDLVYGLRGSDRKCEFLVHNVQADNGTSDYPSPGQLLLDLIELESELVRYSEIMPVDKQTKIVRCDEPRDGFIECEKCIWEAIGSGLSIADLERGMFTEFERVVGLLTLLDRKQIALVSESSGKASATNAQVSVNNLKLREEPRESLFSAIEAQLQFDGFDDLDLLSDDTVETTVKVAPQSESAVENGAPAPIIEPTIASFPPALSSAIENCSEAIENNASQVQALGGLIGAEPQESPAPSPAKTGLNARLMKAELRQPIILTLIIIWLSMVFLASLVPDGIVDQWFHALSEISSE